MDIKVMPAGDSALVAEFGTSVDEEVNEKVHALWRRKYAGRIFPELRRWFLLFAL